MRKEVDYIAIHREEMEMFSGHAEPPSEADWRRFHLETQLMDARESQFTRVKNEEKWRRVEDVLYPALCELAELQGGRVELDINEHALFAQLAYTGELLFLDHSACMGLAAFNAAVSAADDLFVSVEDGLFHLQFLFCLYDKIQTADHSLEISAIEAKIRRHRLETSREKGI